MATMGFASFRTQLPELQTAHTSCRLRLPVFGYTVIYSGRQSSQLSGGSTPSPGPPNEGDGVTGNNTAPSFAAPPPPPPPPPPASGPLPSVRLSSEIPDSRKGGGYEPPAAIQNAMLTKDKKPFTYTPGGLDLSQIRSPRMQRRITRNANAEGVGEHPQIEGRNEPPQAPQPQYQPVQQQYQPVQQQYQPVQQQHQQAAVPSNQPQTRIIPIQIEGSSTAVNSAPSQQQQQRRPVYMHNKFNPPTSPQSPAPYNNSPGSDSSSEQNPRQYQHQQSWGPPGGNGAPIQSRSFRVLQKITDTDNSEGESEVQPQQYVPPNTGRGQWNNEGVPVQQMRKLELSEDDRALMNKFRAQVDEDSFLHTESDPRYRGAAIPSRAFRLLQNMTDGSGDNSEQVPRGPAASRGPQTRQVPVQQSPPVDGAAPQPYIPPSEQQVPEPRKYTGGAIPSRSFRMLQAMTAPENCGPGQSDM